MKIKLQQGASLVDGRYILDAKLGEGGMATVWSAHQTYSDELPKQLVLKILLNDIRKDEDRRAMFMEEARLSLHLQHPYIVSIHNLESWANLDILVMERIWGVSLDRFLKLAHPPEPMPWPLAVKMCSMASQALHYANQEATIDGTPLHLIHRDIKPANLLLTTEGILKVIDFGIAKASVSQIKTRTGLVKGTVAYMSPEQLHADPLDIRSDLHSLGSVLYQLCSGERPFANESITSLILQILNEPHEPLIKKIPSVPPELSHVVDKLLSKERVDRPSDALLLYQQLEDILAIHQQNVTPSDLQAYFGEKFPDVYKAWQEAEGILPTNRRVAVDSEDTLPQRTVESEPALGLSLAQQDRLSQVPANASTVRIPDTPFDLPTNRPFNGLDDDDDEVTLRRNFNPEAVAQAASRQPRQRSLGSDDTLTAPKNLSYPGNTELDDGSIPAKLAQMKAERESAQAAPDSQERWFQPPQPGSSPPKATSRKPSAPPQPAGAALFEDEEYTYREAFTAAKPSKTKLDEEWRQVLPASLASLPADETVHVDSHPPETSKTSPSISPRLLVMLIVVVGILGAAIWFFTS